jgi:hypothetical protein
MIATLEAMGRDPPKPSTCSTSGECIRRRSSASRRGPGLGRSVAWEYGASEQCVGAGLVWSVRLVGGFLEAFYGFALV